MIGSELAQKRHLLSMTQPQLAERLGVHPVTVSNWERGADEVPRYAESFVDAELGRRVAESKLADLSSITTT